MCTIVVFRHVHPTLPLLIAANRDEFYARASTPPLVLSTEPRVVGGRDGERLGTWMGVTPQGFFAGITNQRTWGGADRSLRSRGEVVLETLRTNDVDAAEHYLRGLHAREFNSFNLLFGTARDLRIAYARADQDSLVIEAVPQGIHVLPNDALDSPEFPKAARAVSAATALQARPWNELTSALPTMLADHRTAALQELPEPPEDSPFSRELVQALDAICIHTPAYGTRSSTLLALEDGRVHGYHFAAGPPCVTPYQDFTSMVHGAG